METSGGALSKKHQPAVAPHLQSGGRHPVQLQRLHIARAGHGLGASRGFTGSSVGQSELDTTTRFRDNGTDGDKYSGCNIKSAPLCWFVDTVPFCLLY